jgi:hypothetical protein
MPTEEPRPGDPKLLIFSYVVSIIRALIPLQLRRGAGVLLFGVTPGVPITLATTLSKGWPRKAFFYGLILGYFFCLGVVVAWTMAVGTFQGTDPNRLYYRHDLTNIINYAFICPFYIGCAATLVVLACKSWADLRSNAELASSTDYRAPRLPLGIAFFIIIGLAAAFTCNYIRECLNPQIYEKVFWYIDSVDSEGHRVLGGLGVYYALLTYSLFLVCFSAAFSLFFLFTTAAEITRYIRAHESSTIPSFETLRANLSNFVSAYIVGKCFTALLMFNVFTWKWSQSRPSFNLFAMAAVLTIGGIFIISIPRYYIELVWYEVIVQRSIEAGEPPPEDSRDIRSKNIRLFAWVLDGLIISGFIFSFWLSFIHL